MKRPFLLLTCTLISLWCVAQYDHQEFLDETMALVSNEFDAKYYREVTPDLDQYQVRVFYKEGKLRMTGTYSDPQLTLMNGQFTYYYEIGSKESQGHYRGGFKTGAWKRWNWEGDPKADRLYPEKSPTEIAKKWRTEPAQFPGGHAGLAAYISENLTYPEEAKAQGIQGDVNVAFNIDAEGAIQDVQIVESVHYYLDKEALRLVFKMPHWKPAVKRGVPIRAKFILPLTFRLPDNKPSDQ